MNRIAVRLAALVSATLIAMPANAQTDRQAVDLELVLAVDVSRSIDDFEHELQRKGYLAALSDPEVLRAIKSGPLGRVAFAYVEWSGPFEQNTLVNWAVISDEASAAAFVARLEEQPRAFFDGTSISGAIDYGREILKKNAIEGTRRVIDISADGANRHGRPAPDARDDAVREGITINGLAIINDRPSRAPWPEPPLDDFMRENVIGGPGAFLVVVKGFKSFGDAIKRKLILEIVGLPQPNKRASAR